MLVQMISSTSIICLTGFQAVVVRYLLDEDIIAWLACIMIDFHRSKQVGGQSSNIMKYGIYLSAAMSQLFYICWLGNELGYAVRID